MLKFNLFKRNKAKKTDFFELSSREQKKILKKVIHGANKDQKELAKEYDKRYGNSGIEECHGNFNRA